MYVIIGKYGVLMDESGLVLTHPTGISFDLTPDEADGLMRFIRVYQDAMAASERDTEPCMERIVIDEGSNALERDTEPHMERIVIDEGSNASQRETGKHEQPE